MDLRTHPDAQAAAFAAAHYVAEALGTAPSDRPLVLAVSGGRTPEPLYRRLATLDVPWSRLHVVWVDERVVPHADARSNARLVHETLLAHVPVAAHRVHPVATGLGGAKAASFYDALLRRLLGPDGGPTVSVLGMGDDGHVASLFPGATLDHGPRFAVRTTAPESAPVRERVSMTLPLLNRSAHAVFLVTGAAKAPALADVRAGACPARPAACVAAPTTVWFVDAAAAGP